MKKEKITHTGGVPFILRTLVDAGLTDKDCDLELISYGGAPSGEDFILVLRAV